MGLREREKASLFDYAAVASVFATAVAPATPGLNKSSDIVRFSVTS